ncbi:hypothetical protein [Virgibacillus sp. L01]|uniref:hypothetical protein n=1 Tax=Virgibacillus sp. L01 TaxID=3457429 RepID=UPI003FD650BE
MLQRRLLIQTQSIITTSSLLVVSNFTSKFVHFDIPEDFLKATKLIGNYHEHNEDSRQKLELKPYASCVYYDADS